MKNHWLEKIKNKELLKKKAAEMHDVGCCNDFESFAKALKKILDTTQAKKSWPALCPKGPKGPKGMVGSPYPD